MLSARIYFKHVFFVLILLWWRQAAALVGAAQTLKAFLAFQAEKERNVPWTILLGRPHFLNTSKTPLFFLFCLCMCTPRFQRSCFIYLTYRATLFGLFSLLLSFLFVWFQYLIFSDHTNNLAFYINNDSNNYYVVWTNSAVLRTFSSQIQGDTRWLIDVQKTILRVKAFEPSNQKKELKDENAEGNCRVRGSSLWNHHLIDNTVVLISVASNHKYCFSQRLYTFNPVSLTMNQTYAFISFALQ